MAFKMVSTRNDPKEAKENAKPCDVEQPAWRYGFRLQFDEKMLAEMPALKSAKAGDRIKIAGEGCVVLVGGEDKMVDGKKKEDRRVDIQIEKIGVANREDYDESFDEATGKEDEE